MRFYNPLAGTLYERAWGPGGGTHHFGQNWQSSWGWDLLHSSAPHPVFAPVSGVVKSAGQGGSGRFAGAKVGIEGADLSVFLTHMSEIYVEYGQRVVEGQLIGKTGQANGVYHLHIATAKGPYHSPEGRGFDPKQWLDESAAAQGTGPNGYPLFRGLEGQGSVDGRTFKQRAMDAGFGAKSADALPALLKSYGKHVKSGGKPGAPRKGDSNLFRRLRREGFGVNSARKIVKSLRRPWK